jgi:hypothetical protein
MIAESEKYTHRLTTNHCEAFNSLIVHYAPVTIYSHLIHLAVLRKLLGPRYVLFLLCSLQIPVDDDLRFSYQELEEKAIMNANRKRTESYKNRRVHLVSQRKNKKAASADPEYTYKPPDHCGHQTRCVSVSRVGLHVIGVVYVKQLFQPRKERYVSHLN